MTQLSFSVVQSGPGGLQGGFHGGWKKVLAVVPASRFRRLRVNLPP